LTQIYVTIILIQRAALEWDDSQTAVLMDWVEYKKQRSYGVSVVKCHLACYFLKITSPLVVFLA